jgi:hypothetical protein
LIDVFRPAVFVDPGRFPNGRAIDFLALDPRHVNARLGAGRENTPGRGDGLGGRGGAAAPGRKDHVSETAAAAIKDDILDFADILAARIFDF